MADKVIFAEQTVEFAVAEFPDGTFYHVTLFDDFVPLTLGATYRVIWGDDEYICIATDMDGMAGIGNVTILQTIGLDMPGTDTGEPFVIAVDTGAVVIYTLDPSTTSRIVAIYEVAAEDKQYLIYGSTLTGIADAIKAKTGNSDPIPVTNMATQIAGITTGGGSVEGAHYVTFMSEDGSVTLGSKAVMEGDDCGNPLEIGLFDTPSKDSTAQYDYTFVGWATTPYGAWDEKALDVVTEDRTVYAAFASVVKYYTATFYDGDTVMKTETLAYGSKATPPDTTKDGYSFGGWTPSDLTIYGDTDFVGAWEKLSGLYYVTAITGLSRMSGAQDVAINNDGTQVAFAPYKNDTALDIYDLTTGNQLSTSALAAAASIRRCDYNHDSSCLLLQDDTNVKAYYTSNGLFNQYANLMTSTARTTMSAARSANRAAFFGYVSSKYYVYVAYSTGGTLYQTTAGAISGAKELRISEDGNYVVSSDRNKNVYVINKGSVIKTLPLSSNANFMSWNGDGTKVAISLASSPWVEIYETTNWTKVADLSEYVSEASYAEFIAGTSLLVVGGGTTVNVFDMSGNTPQKIETHPVYAGGTIKRVKSNNTGTRVAFLHSEGVEVWGTLE